MANQSERQLGALLIICLQEGMANRLEAQRSTFRNKVIHKGYIPSSKEVIDYGQYVLTFIQTTLKELNETSNEYLQKVMQIHLTKNGDKLPENVHLAGVSMSTIIS
ncbi:hypothetical protein EKL97_15285 [Flavobacterium sp. LS1P28]|uniref:hypothetical protein n=1 Tax=Flavobacterium sp. LS1P28 TaxID=2497752 RepID=UPI000F82EC9A|nr:hypothetical protein [Flavobacterium sp. LS1P28]RTY77475.1 hypothetical protein EKL97_15285 [Flavobacterium sp. LS1P28]